MDRVQQSEISLLYYENLQKNNQKCVKCSRPFDDRWRSMICDSAHQTVEFLTSCSPFFGLNEGEKKIEDAFLKTRCVYTPRSFPW